jgi:hypothetical protein
VSDEESGDRGDHQEDGGGGDDEEKGAARELTVVRNGVSRYVVAHFVVS